MENLRLSTSAKGVIATRLLQFTLLTGLVTLNGFTKATTTLAANALSSAETIHFFRYRIGLAFVIFHIEKFIPFDACSGTHTNTYSSICAANANGSNSIESVKSQVAHKSERFRCFAHTLQHGENEMKCKINKQGGNKSLLSGDCVNMLISWKCIPSSDGNVISFISRRFFQSHTHTDRLTRAARTQSV